MKNRDLGEGGFLAAETAVLALLLLFAVAALAGIEQSAALLAQSEAETSALFLAEHELAWAERQAGCWKGRSSLPAGRVRETEENGRRFLLETAFSQEGQGDVAVCLANVHVFWTEAGREQELSLERTVPLGE